MYNGLPVAAAVELGLTSFDVPADWEVTTDPSQTLTVGPRSEEVVKAMVKIPCPPTLQATRARQEMYAMRENAGSVPTIDVEGYIDGELMGGIEIQFPSGLEDHLVYLPVILKEW